MADLHTEFDTYHGRVALTPGRKASLLKARNALRDRIRSYFKTELEVVVPKFRMQGSYAMGTTVNPLDGEFDVDDGVYLQHLDGQDDCDWPTPETVHRWLVEATKGHTNEKPIDKRTCVRVQYAGQYHVDLPSYGLLRADWLLAEKGAAGWHASDPKSLTDWFKKYVVAYGDQLARIVRYLKAWSDFQSGKQGKMPSSLILTVLAAQNFRANDRDDIALANTAAAIRNAVHPIFCLYNPVDGSEELTARLTAEQKQRFQAAISDLADSSAEAIDEKKRSQASETWRKQLGERFPLVEEDEENEQRRKDAAALAAFYVPKKPARPWAWEQ